MPRAPGAAVSPPVSAQLHLFPSNAIPPSPPYIFTSPPHNLPPLTSSPQNLFSPLPMKFTFHPLNAILIPDPVFPNVQDHPSDESRFFIIFHPWSSEQCVHRTQDGPQTAWAELLQPLLEQGNSSVLWQTSGCQRVDSWTLCFVSSLATASWPTSNLSFIWINTDRGDTQMNTQLSLWEMLF